MLIVNCINLVDVQYKDYQLLKNSVSQNRLKKAEQFYFYKDSVRCLCADLLLQYSLYEVFGGFVEYDIEYNAFGKPFIKQMKDFYYNLSHSGDWVVIIYGKTKVGIDIEKVQVGKEYICDNHFNKKEISWIHEISGLEEIHRFTKMWTLKESYLKYLGTGLSFGLDSFYINVEEGKVTNSDGVIQNNIKIKSYLFDKEYYLSVCGVEEDIQIKEVSLERYIAFAKEVKENKQILR